MSRKRIYKMHDNEKHYVANQTLGGFASTTNPNDAKVFNLENDNDRKLHDFIVSNYNAISEETLENKKTGGIRMNYFKITGLDNGIEIEPYIIETWGNVPHLEVYGDKARYVEPISKKKAMELIEQGVELV